LFYDVHKENMFTTNLEDGREAPSKARKKGAKRLEFLVLYIYIKHTCRHQYRVILYTYIHADTSIRVILYTYIHVYTSIRVILYIYIDVDTSVE